MSECKQSATAARSTSVYRYFDAFDVMIYVGITARGAIRNAEHDRSQPWWPFAVRQEIEQHPTRELALARERELIERHTPPFNVQHNPEHRQMREAYLSVAAQASAAADPGDLLTSLGGVLPLHIVKEYRSDAGSRVVELRTEAAHAGIASRLRHDNSTKLSDASGIRFGRVVSITPQGPFALITAHVRLGADLDGCTAKVKRVAIRGPVTFSLRRIAVPHSVAAA